MLPECRQQEYLFSVPKFDVASSDVESFADELRCFHDEYRDCFHRSETRENVFHYMVGQFSKLERKSIEPIALAVEDAKVRAMQRAVSGTNWDEEKLLAKYRSMVNDDMGGPDGVLMFDESGFVKKRREKCDFPKCLTFKTKPQMASEMLAEIHRQEIIPYKYIVADSIYGHSPDFIEAAEKLDGKIYLVSISSDTLKWTGIFGPVVKSQIW